MKIYVDVVFLINFVMNMIIYFLSSIFLMKKIIKWKLLLAGIVTGLLYCLFMFVPALHNFYNFFTSLLMVSTGIFICFYPFTKKEFVKIIFVVHIVSFAVGGIGMAMFYVTNIGDYIGEMVSFSVKNFSIKILISSTCLSYVFVKIVNNFLKNFRLRKEDFAEVTVFYNNHSIVGKVLIDTGNSLKDTLTNTHIIILEFELIKDFLPSELKLLFYEKREDNLELLMGRVAGTWIEKNIRLVPFASIGNQHGMLIGFSPTKVNINWDNNIIELDRVIIGISNFSISKDKKFQGIINPEILEKIVE